VNRPSPAIVAQSAVRRLPRAALLLFCLAYVLPGFFGRAPWRVEDITAFGFMRELAMGRTDWLMPRLYGQAPEFDALLPYWLGAGMLQVLPAWVPADLATRLPFIALLTLTLAAVWQGTYYLARSPQAQPVAFAFGGEAKPTDYARAMADGALLALMASLGLAQLSHETTPALTQLGCAALTYFAVAALPYRRVAPWLALAVGLPGLALSGAPTTAVLLGAGALALHHLNRPQDHPHTPYPPRFDNHTAHRQTSAFLAGLLLLVLVLIVVLGLWRWRLHTPAFNGASWQSLFTLLVWFTWPAWPLAALTLWRWRRQLLRLRDPQDGLVASRHLAWPLWFVVVTLTGTLFTSAGDRALLLALPALATLAAFALPTLERSLAALIDWFTLLFFSGCAFVIWVVWLAMQTGVPEQPAANVQRLAPGFEPHFEMLPFVLAVIATLAWAWLVRWRVGRHRAAIWKSLVLPSGGAALCWLLLTTLWMPLLNHARSYEPLVRQVQAITGNSPCVQSWGLQRGLMTAFDFHAGRQLAIAPVATACEWLLVDKDQAGSLAGNMDMSAWVLHSALGHPRPGEEDLLIYRRLLPAHD
jgi:hypothetical protein